MKFQHVLSILTLASVTLATSVLAETRCDQIWKDFAPENCEVQADSPLMFNVHFGGGETSAENAFFKTCMVLSDGRVAIQTQRGDPGTKVCKLRSGHAKTVKKLTQRIPALAANPLQRTEGSEDIPSLFLSFREGNQMAEWEETGGGSTVTRGDSPSVEAVRSTLLELCHSQEDYEYRRETFPDGR